MSATATYGTLTGRTITPRISGWIGDLVEKHGEQAVVAALEYEARQGEMKTLLSRVGDRLAKQAVAKLGPAIGREPLHLSAGDILAIARGEQPAPDLAFTWSTQGMTAAEYREVLVSPLVRGSIRPAAGEPATMTAAEPVR